MSAAQFLDGGPQLVDEPSAWLRGAGANRVRQINAHLKDIDVSAYGLVIAPIGQTGAPGSVEDRSCDRCRVFVPDADELTLFTYRAAPRLILAGGLCASCARKEAG